MTHWDCEPAWNFVPQEFALPETLTTLRKMVLVFDLLAFTPPFPNKRLNQGSQTYIDLRVAFLRKNALRAAN
jgi:hypothetical protein